MQAFVDNRALYAKALYVALGLERLCVHFVVILLDGPNLCLEFPHFHPILVFRRACHDPKSRWPPA